MKIAVTAIGNDLACELDSRFGRAANFIVVDSNTMEYELVPNKQSLHLPQGAGIQAAKTVVDAGAQVVITGNCGPKAFKAFQQAGVDVILQSSGSVRDVLERYNRGEFKVSHQANVDGHWI